MLNKDFKRTAFQQEESLKIESSGPRGKCFVLCQQPGTSNELMVREYHHGYRILLGSGTGFCESSFSRK